MKIPGLRDKRFPIFGPPGCSGSIRHYLLLTCAICILSACQTAPGGRFNGLTPLDSATGDVYLYKVDSIKIQKRFSVRMGNGPAAYLYNASYLYYRLPPGFYEIVVSPGPMLINSRLKIEVKAGERGFYEYSTTPTPLTIDFGIGSSLDARSPAVATASLATLSSARKEDTESGPDPLLPRQPQARRRVFPTTGFAAIADVDAVPLLNARGREGYRQWLQKNFVRAFVIAEDGAWIATWNAYPLVPQESTDPLTRALERCDKLGYKNCRPYAIDKRVVWSTDAPINAK